MKTKQCPKWVLLFIVLITVGLYASPTAVFASSVGEHFERALGAGAVSKLVEQYGGEYILPIQERFWVNEIFNRLVKVTERGEVEYTLTVLNSHEANAFALPGGYVFITRGLLNIIGSDEAKLAAVLGHEMAHVEKKHGVNAVLRQMGLTVLMEVGMIAIDFASADVLRLASATLLQLLQLGWGREAEYEADLLGQTLAAQAGFDPLGAIRLLDDLKQADPDDLPMKVFRTHPDLINRRKRLEENLISFWSKPELVSAKELQERLNGGRNSHQDRRSDPKGRYVVEPDLAIFDKQTEQYVNWLNGVSIKEFIWSPQGDYFAVLLAGDQFGELVIYDRFGHQIRKIDASLGGPITAVSWSPTGEMIALDVATRHGGQVVATPVLTEVFATVSRDLVAENGIWLDDGLYFYSQGQWYYTVQPQVRPVIFSNPVPQVLQRKRILSPTVIKEGNTLRLTRPSLTLP